MLTVLEMKTTFSNVLTCPNIIVELQRELVSHVVALISKVFVNQGFGILVAIGNIISLGRCPYGWTHSPATDMCYKWFEQTGDMRTWEDAETYCQSIAVNNV